MSRKIMVGEGIISKHINHKDNMLMVLPKSTGIDVDNYLKGCGCQLIYKDQQVTQRLCPSTSNSYMVTIINTL